MPCDVTRAPQEMVCELFLGRVSSAGHQVVSHSCSLGLDSWEPSFAA